jgi:regulatory protein
MKKEMTEQEAYLQLAALCAQAEHCQQEMRDKMRRWGLDETVQNRIIDRLIKERYVDDERYARAFVKDKIRYNKWGRRKVQQALWMKRIDADIQQQVLDEIDEKEYLDVLRPLLKQKRKSIKAESDYELNQKLLRFALSRGFGFDIIRQCLDVGEEDYSEEMADETD